MQYGIRISPALCESLLLRTREDDPCGLWRTNLRAAPLAAGHQHRWLSPQLERHRCGASSLASSLGSRHHATGDSQSSLVTFLDGLAERTAGRGVGAGSRRVDGWAAAAEACARVVARELAQGRAVVGLRAAAKGRRRAAEGP
jgi:hypothetical protein